MKLIKGDTEYHIVPIKLAQEEYDDIEKYAAVGYTPSQIALCLDVDPEELKRQLTMEESLIYMHYHRGLLQSDFKISSKLLENAESGDITAVEVFQKRRESVHLHNLKRIILNGGS